MVTVTPLYKNKHIYYVINKFVYLFCTVTESLILQEKPDLLFRFYLPVLWYNEIKYYSYKC